MNENLLKLLNLKFKSRYHSTVNLISNHPSAIAYIPEPTLEEFLSFFRRVGLEIDSNKSLDPVTVEKTVMRAIRKFPSVRDEEVFLNTIVRYPRVINTINTQERYIADGLFIRALYRKRIYDKDFGPTPELISFIDKPNFRMRFFSARFEPDSIRLMGNVKNRVINEAIRSKPSTIQYVENPTFDQKRLAIGGDVRVLGLIKNQDKADAKIALSLNPEAIQYIRPENRDINMLEEALTEGNNQFPWLTIENFSSYNFSIEEIKLMVKLGGLILVGLLALLKINNKLDLPEEVVLEIEKRLNLKLDN